uniref:Ribosome-recycling factor n=1 Tax=candidate division WOR-3 bacterium TaxID=2052148 RepID=A0A7V3RG42_UNCW3
MDKIKEEAKQKMEKSLNLLNQEFAKIRTGRATPALLDGVKVEYYDTVLPLNQVASISIPEPRLIVIQPWDKQALSAIEKAIYKADIGLTPNNDGNVIRLSLPPLTAERREELVKLAQKLAEESRVAIRNIRRDANNELKKLEKEKKISEDDSFKGQESIQKLTDEYIKKVDEILKKKEKEIKEI